MIPGISSSFSMRLQARATSACGDGYTGACSMGEQGVAPRCDSDKFPRDRVLRHGIQ